MAAVTIELDLDLHVITRSGLGVFNFLSDIGGFQSMLITVFTMILGATNHEQVENYLAARLFKRKQASRRRQVTETRSDSLREYIRGLLPQCCLVRCCRCRWNSRQAALAQAHALLDDELDVVKVLQALRFSLLALRHLLPKHEHEALS